VEKQVNHDNRARRLKVKPKKYIKLQHTNPEHQEWFVVNWCLGNTCNYSCSYCIPQLNDGSVPWPNREDIMGFINRTVQQVAPRKVYFEFTGGEVTLYKHFIEICQHVTSLGCKVGLISNGSRTIRWWEENKQYFDHVCLSFHPEEADPDHFLQVVKLLQDDVRVHVNIMMSPNNWGDSIELAERMAETQNVSLALQPLLVEFSEEKIKYTPEQDAIINNQYFIYGNKIQWNREVQTYRGGMSKIFPDGREVPRAPHRIINEGGNSWKGWSCYAGVEQIVVDMDGGIYRGWCKVGGRIGSIFDQTTNIPTQPVTCDKAACHCNFDIMCTKELNG
jgi:MoaA/NifB/PqqE/SkfB family radical SAM enzyme